MSRVNIGRVLLAIAFIAMPASLALADAVPYINDYELLTTVTRVEGTEAFTSLVINAGVGVIEVPEGLDAYTEISTGAGTFVRVDPLKPRSSATFVGLRDDDQYWSFVFVYNISTGSTTITRVTTPSYVVGTVNECNISPCVPPGQIYAFAVVVERGRGALQYIGAR